MPTAAIYARYSSDRQRPSSIEDQVRHAEGQCIYLHRFGSLEQAHAIIAAFIERYNHEWLIERLGYRTPADVQAVASAAA